MSFDRLGWQIFAPEEALKTWITHAKPEAVKAARDETLFGDWLRCGGTWFVGVDALPNDAMGRVGSGPPLTGACVDFVTRREGALPLHRAQISVIYPGYPKPSLAESDAAFRFRRHRAAAHVDGLLPIGPDKRRFLQEPHAYVLGIPLAETKAAPMVVWDGSHHLMRAAFQAALGGIDPAEWTKTDLTQIYQETRKRCFDTCTRREITVPLGGAYVIHRLALHGVAPWQDHDTAPEEGRMIAYLRPQLPDIRNWLA